MSMKKAIASGKEKRKPYRKSARFDPACRHGGSCPWCIGNRTVGTKRLHERAIEREQDES